MAEEYIEEQVEEHAEEHADEHVEEHAEEHAGEHAEDHVEEYADEHTEEHVEQQDMGDLPESSHPFEENIEEQETGAMPEISHNPEIEGSELDSKADNRVISEEKKWPGWPGENVFRMLVPVQKVGSIIGRKGEYIKKTCEETKARIKILDGPPGTTERTVMVSAKEEPDLPVPPAMDGLLKVHKRIVDVDSDSAHVTPAVGQTVCTRMLVAGTQGGSLIGKQGATIKTIQDASNCTIRVLNGAENLPFFALPDDSVVEVQGEAAGVRKAIELIATHLRKFLVDRSVIGIFETQMQNPRGNQEMPPSQPWGPPHQAFPMNAGPGSGFAPISQYVPPQRQQFDNYYPQGDMPPMDKQPRQGGPPSYNRDASMGTHTSSMQAHQSMVTKVSQNMQIPLIYADTVIGTAGANISYIRRASGATIAIQESRVIPGEMTVEINGSASQVQTAQQLIQNFIAEAASAAQNSQGAPPAGGQGYNPYPSHGAAYPSQQPDATGHTSAGDYASVCGNNYGY